MIRRLLAVVPVAALVACGPYTAPSGAVDAPLRNGTVATRVATSPTTTEPAAVSSAAPPVARHVASRRPVHAAGGSARAAATDGCNRNYTPCVPDDPVDVDCAGGSGNGPSYVTGPVRVIGEDVYGLDADHNGIGCEASTAAPQASSRPAPAPAAPSTTRAAPPPTTTKPPRTTQEAPSAADSQSAPFRSESDAAVIQP